MLRFELPNYFVDCDPAEPGRGPFLAASDLNLFQQCAQLLDQLSYRKQPSFDSDRNASSHTEGDFRAWWGAVRYRTGMTSLVVPGYADSFGSATLNFYINGILKATITPSSSFSSTIAISSGYSNGEILHLEAITSGNTSSTSTYQITGAYATPIVVSSSWGGVPSFSSVFNADRLNQLRAACQNLYDRIIAVPLPSQIGYVYSPSSHKVESAILYDGAIMRSNAGEVLKIRGSATIMNAAEYFTVSLNGSVVYTSSTFAAGTTNVINTAIDLSAYTLGARVRVRITAVITDASNQPEGMKPNSRYNISVNRVQAGASGYPVASPPTAFVAAGSLSASTINTRLNSIATMLSDVNTRMVARPEVWQRAYAIRRLFAHDDHELTKGAKQYPHVLTRRGDRVIVHGKGVRIGWGGTTVKSKEDALDYDDYTFAYEEQATSGEYYETQTIYLDALRGLFRDMPYFLWGGDLVYAAEEYV